MIILTLILALGFAIVAVIFALQNTALVTVTFFAGTVYFAVGGSRGLDWRAGDDSRIN